MGNERKRLNPGQVLKPVATTTLDEVIGCTGYTGNAHSIEDMDAAITAGIKSRHARG